MHHGYGITEYAGSMFITDMDRPRGDCSSGSAVDGVEWRIGSPDRATPEPGERGTILIRGPASCWAITAIPSRRRARVARRLAGYRRYRLRGCRRRVVHRRTQQDLIIRSGFNVYPIEVESVINAFPGVRLSAVGRQTEDHNEGRRLRRRCPAPRWTPACWMLHLRAARAVQAARADHSHRRHTHHGQRKNPEAAAERPVGVAAEPVPRRDRPAHKEQREPQDPVRRRGRRGLGDAGLERLSDRPIRLLVGYALAVPWTPRRASSPNTWATSWDSP